VSARAGGVSAAVMAGGRSRRMGRDKAWLEVEGRPIIARVVAVLREVADEVLVVANDPRYAELGLRVVPDRFPEGGALGGIATGVGASAHDRVLVAACDMPYLRADVWRVLLERADGADAVVPRIGGEYETLHALYTKACLAPMERALGAGRLRVISFFGDVRVREVGEDELRALDPDLRSFTNLNTPEELAAADPAGGRRRRFAARVSGAVDRVLARVEGLPEERWRARCEAEGWSVGFEAYHIARGLERQRGWLEASRRGEPPFAFDWDETHALNAELVATHGDPPREATLALLRAELAKTAALVGTLSDAELARICMVSGERELSAERVVSIVMVRHVEGHLASIERALS
jgi:molybdopterin-guanine dinucleotide biosynthesis protein A